MSKERSNNFSPQELNKLKDLLEKYSVILNKKTDHASAKQKDEAWNQLTNEFNANNAIYRTKKQLIYKFNNMKKNARKELSQEKKERRCTGGGPAPPKPSDTSEWICSIMSESIVGLPSTHDSDFTDFTLEETENIEFNDQNITTDEGDKTDIIISDSIDIIPIPHSQENQETVKFDASTPHAMLQQPVSKPLEPGNRKRKLIYISHVLKADQNSQKTPSVTSTYRSSFETGHSSSINKINSVIDRIVEDESVDSVILINQQGEPVYTNISVVNATNFGRKINPLGQVVRDAVKDLDVFDEVMVLRIDTKKHEIMMVPQEDFGVIVVQRARLKAARKITKKMLEM